MAQRVLSVSTRNEQDPKKNNFKKCNQSLHSIETCGIADDFYSCTTHVQFRGLI